LEERIARLRREVEECRVLAAQEDGEDGEGVEGLKVLVESLDMEMDGRRKGEKETKGLRREGSSGTPGAWPDGEMEMSEERLLGRVADFDARLAGLEGALGLAAVDATGVEGATVMPLLPSLAVLDQQLSALSSASSTANLEAMASRIQRLRSEADNALTQPSPNETTEPDADGESTSLSPEDRESLTKLYTLLPTLHNLAPTVPALLTRLRSLRTLHTNAANAASALEDVEKRQAEMDRELSTWRQGLEKVEAAVARANEGNGRNGKFVEGWVRDLEKRMQTLPR
jgi:nuclear migration protein JNM1